MIKTIFLGLIIFLQYNLSVAQQWESFDLGISFQSISSAGVKKIKINPLNNELYVGGVFYYDNRGRNIRGFTRWNKNVNRWDTTLVDKFSFCRTFEFIDNRIYAAGSFLNVGPPEDFSRFYYREDNSWHHINSGPIGTIINSRIINNELYLVGVFEEVDEQPTYGISKYNLNNFNSFFPEFADDLHRIDDIIEWKNELYVVGKNMNGFPDYTWSGLAKINNGVLEEVHSDFALPNLAWVYSLEVFQNKLFVGGNFHKETGYTGNGIQYFDNEGMHEVNGGVNGTVYSMKVYKGELYVVGLFTRIGSEVVHGTNEGTPCNGVAKWDGEQWTCLFDGEIDILNWYGVRTLEIYNDTLYIGGNWLSMNGDTTMSCIAKRKITPKPGILTLDNFTLYPNPTNNQLHFDFGYLINEDVNVNIYNPIGQLIEIITIPAWEQTYTFDTASLSKGVYFVKVNLGEAVQTKKVIIQ